MKAKLEDLLTTTHKAEMIVYMKSHPEDFHEVFKLAIADKQPYSFLRYKAFRHLLQFQKSTQRYLMK